MHSLSEEKAFIFRISLSIFLEGLVSHHDIVGAAFTLSFRTDDYVS
jgi:hypothetical protein